LDFCETFFLNVRGVSSQEPDLPVFDAVASGQGNGMSDNRKKLAGVATAAVLALGLALAATACTSGGTAGSGPGGSGAAGAKPASAAPRYVTISPGSGAKDADPSKGIAVAAERGTLTNVSVRTPGSTVTGTYSSGKTSWHSTWALGVSQSYSVTATADVNGKSVTTTSAFTTLTPSRTFTTQITEGDDETYGVGMPIILYFSRKITDPAAVERSFQVATSTPVVGAWYWDSTCNMAVSCAYFRPRDYWPAGTTVSFTGHLNGVEGAPGVYGDHTLTQAFRIGPSVVAVGDPGTHRTQIYVDGALRYNWPISAGKPGDDTPDGSYLTIDKGNPVRMTGPGYNLLVPWSVRFTFSGDYYHDAYWSVSQQGAENVSHGCVNLSPADAEAYYKMEVAGDPITILGSPRAGVWDNGWTEWFLTWPQLVSGSALHEAVETGPNGSTFVSPSAVPPDTAKSPLQTSPANNSAAAD
jgi:lipoprotein-anchoring transpeptidase ErfK/SrfK